MTIRSWLDGPHARRRPGRWLSVRHGLAQERTTTIAENPKAGGLAAPCISFRPFQGSTPPNGPRRKPGRTPDATARYLLRR